MHLASSSSTAFAKVTEVPAELRLEGDFRLAPGMVADLVVQGFDRCNAIHAAGHRGQFELNGDVPAQVRALPFFTDHEQRELDEHRCRRADGGRAWLGRLPGRLAHDR